MSLFFQEELLAVLKPCSCEKSAIAISKAKKSILESEENFKAMALKAEALYFRDLFSSSDMKEGTAAFMEKRKPIFKGK